MLHNGMPYDLI